MPSKAEVLFASKAPWIMELLMRDFSLELSDAAAILGNLGHECAGFTLMQEQKPTVKGSAGGYGWAQWTGPRRRAFEAYCSRNKLLPSEDRANYGWLFVELTTTEKAAIPAVKKARTLNDKVKAFELAFERAGVKHYPSRNAWAARALEAYAAAPKPIAMPAWAGADSEPDDGDRCDGGYDLREGETYGEWKCACGASGPEGCLFGRAEPPKPPIPAPDDEPDPIARQPDDPGVEPGTAPRRGLLAIIIELILSLFRKAPA